MKRITEHEEIIGLTIKDVRITLDGYVVIFNEDAYIYIATHVNFYGYDGYDSYISWDEEFALEYQLEIGAISEEEYAQLSQEREAKRKESIMERELKQLRRLTEKYPGMLKKATDAKK